jgi:hypothetical protein
LKKWILGVQVAALLIDFFSHPPAAQAGGDCSYFNQ